MPKLLAIDTSSESCSVALYLDGEYTSLSERAPRQQARLILPLIQRLLEAKSLGLKQLDAVAFGRGPGSFTGLRIASGITQGLAYGAGVPVLPVSSLKATALRAMRVHSETRVMALIDARMDEVYSANYELQDDGKLLARSDERVCAPEALVLPPEFGAHPFVMAGSGVNYASRFPESVLQQVRLQDDGIEVEARFICELALEQYLRGEALEPEQAQPVYIRDEVAWKKLPGRE